MKQAIFLATLSVVMSTSALARDGFPDEIPNGAVNSCQTCHDGNTPTEANLNVFGDQVHSIGLNFNHQEVIWANVFAADADGDGCTNGYELGDPEGIWTGGDAPGEIVGDPAVADCDPNADDDAGTTVEEDAGGDESATDDDTVEQDAGGDESADDDDTAEPDAGDDESDEDSAETADGDNTSADDDGDEAYVEAPTEETDGCQSTSTDGALMAGLFLITTASLRRRRRR